MFDDQGGNIRGWPPEKKSHLAAPYAEPWTASSAAAAGAGWGSLWGWCCRGTGVTAPSRPAWGEAVWHQGTLQHPALNFPALFMVSVSYSPGDARYWNYI